MSPSFVQAYDAGEDGFRSMGKMTEMGTVTGPGLDAGKVGFALKRAGLVHVSGRGVRASRDSTLEWVGFADLGWGCFRLV